MACIWPNAVRMPAYAVGQSRAAWASMTTRVSSMCPATSDVTASSGSPVASAMNFEKSGTNAVVRSESALSCWALSPAAMAFV